MKHTPNTYEALEILRNHYEMFGLRRTVLDLCVQVLSRRRDTFDEEHHVSTRLTGAVEPLAQGIGARNSVDNGHGYEPTEVPVMRHILRVVAERIDPEGCCFVDLGCGRGRALLMAAGLPFQRVIGVELSPEHCEIARDNVARYRSKSARDALRAAIEVHCEDATLFSYPKTNLIVYLFNPFRGSVLQRVLDRLVEQRRESGRELYVILSNPELEQALAQHAGFALVYECQVLASWRSWNLWRCL